MSRVLFGLSMATLGLFSTSALANPPPPKGNSAQKDIVINGVTFSVSENYQFFDWESAPEDFNYEKLPAKSFTNPNGDTHYYQVVHLPDGNLNWYQAAYMAERAGGYLASITSPEENAFVFEQVNDDKYFWRFPAYVEGKSKHNHYEITIGPFLGGYQPGGSEEPAGGWRWLTGEAFAYTNWAQNLDDGIKDKDPRDNTQPNDSGQENQRVMGFGELNVPVSTWGDYMDDVGTYGRERLPGRSYAFIIEYDSMPE